MTSDEARKKLEADPLKLTPRAIDIYLYLKTQPKTEITLQAIAYCVDSHLNRKFCDEPDVFLAGVGGLFSDG